MNDLSRAELLDHELAEAMDKLVIVKSAIYTSGECDPREPPPREDTAGRLHLMGHDPRARGKWRLGGREPPTWTRRAGRSAVLADQLAGSCLQISLVPRNDRHVDPFPVEF